MDNISEYALFGCRCSGTNYVDNLIKKNLMIKKNSKLGWKHTNKILFGLDYRKSDYDNVLFIYVVRNPYDWIRSLSNNRWHATPEVKKYKFSQFIRSEWKSIYDKDFVNPKNPKFGTILTEDLDDLNNYHISPIHMRTYKIKKIEQQLSQIKNFIIINYDEVIKDPQLFIKNLSQKFKLDSSTNFDPILKYKGVTSTDYVKKIYYEINAEDLEYLNNILDWNLENKYGFTKITAI